MARGDGRTGPAGPARRDAPARRDGQPGAPREKTGRAQPPGRDGRDLREAILAATQDLLAERRFDEISVADILGAASVARGSFYFYFASKHDVLAELVRRAVAQGHQAAQPWLARPTDKTAALRHGIATGAQVWRANAPVLRAIVENWRTDPQLTALWLDQMQSFTDATASQIGADPEALARLGGLDVTALASLLTWLGERLYYLAACGVPPFNDDAKLTDTLVYIWASALYGTPAPGTGAPG